MRRPISLTIAGLGAASIAFGVVPLAPDSGSLLATPVACEDGDVTPDGRVFPEPALSATYLTFAEFECGVARLVEQHPDRLRVDTLLDAAPGPEQEVYDVVMTDPTVPAADKERLMVMSSIHGDEIGPREGAARQIEDLLTATNLAGLDADRLLANFELHWVFPNPAGWANGEGFEAGDVTATYSRGNDRGTDLNRNFPVQGYFAFQQAGYFQPEGDAMRELLQEGFAAEQAGESLGWGLGTDNHGQLTDSYLAAGLQIVGQFDFRKSERLATFADRIDDEMANFISTAAFAEFQLATQQAGHDVAGGYRWGTLYDILGYSASGSGIDYYNTPGVVEGVGFATEVTAGKQVANRWTYSGVLNQLWVDSIRAINMAMFKEALETLDGERDFTFELDGDVAYVFDPARITHDDANGRGSEADLENRGGHVLQPYDVSRMDFFAELAPVASAAVDGVLAEDLADTDLSGYTAVVVTSLDELAALGDGEAGAHEALRAYGEQGGTVILTDDALRAAGALLGTEVGVSVVKNYVGAVASFEDGFEDGLNSGLRGVASQTFDTVPIGYAFGGSNNSAPNWRVDTAAWEAAGGVTAGTTSSQTIYGEAPLGDGKVRILGALLPDPTEQFYHPFGLQDYAVTYTGYTLLQNMINVD